MTWQLSEFLPHLADPVRGVDAQVSDGEQARVRLEACGLASSGRMVYPEAPGHLVSLVVPELDEAQFADCEPRLRARYDEARRVVRQASAQLSVVCAPDGDPRQVADALVTEFVPAVGVVTGEACVVACRENYRGRGTGRIFTLAVPSTLPVRARWLVPSAVKALLLAPFASRSAEGAFGAQGGGRPDLPEVIDAEIDGEVHRLEVLAVEEGYWPLPPDHARDERDRSFEQAWAGYFPGLRCPVGWLQWEMRTRDPDPRRVPAAPFLMTGQQRLKFVELWHTVWPQPAPLTAFTDRGGWERAVEAAESLLVATSPAWNRELDVLLHQARHRWAGDAEVLVPMTAAAIYKAARRANVDAVEVAGCQAARLLTAGRVEVLPDGVPLDSVLARKLRSGQGRESDLRGERLRALRMLSCPHPGTASTRECRSVRERIDAADRFGWAVTMADRIVALGADEVGVRVCERCGGPGGWMLARPADAWWWSWALCRCGEATPVEFDHDDPSDGPVWSKASADGFEHFAKEAGFGALMPWTGPAPRIMVDLAGEIETVLPGMMIGGGRAWREAVRVAAGLIADRAGHPAVPRSHDGGILGREIFQALGLAALTVHVLAGQARLGPRQVDLPRALGAGAEALYVGLAAVLPDAVALTRSRDTPLWAERVDAWPGRGWLNPESAGIDPVEATWAVFALAPRAWWHSSDPVETLHYPQARVFHSAHRLLVNLLDAGR